MKKNVLLIILLVILLIGVITFIIIKNYDHNKNADNKTDLENKKILIVYYSAQSHTKNVALKLKEKLNADIFEIEPVDTYTSDDLNWRDNNSRVTKEHNDESLRNIELKETKVDNWDEYDIVLIGYPIWWGIAAWPVNTFVKANNFDNKTVIPFCTSSSSGMGDSGKLLSKETKTGIWKDGYRFSSNATDKDIDAFIDSIKK